MYVCRLSVPSGRPSEERTADGERADQKINAPAGTSRANTGRLASSRNRTIRSKAQTVRRAPIPYDGTVSPLKR
jgi:hypothetical protein